MESSSIEYALLAMQRALLGEVTSTLRAVFVDLDKGQNIFFAGFYYDGEASEQRVDLWNCAVTEASAALGQFFEKSWIKRLDYPEPIPMQGYLAYLRKEGRELDCFKGTPPCVVMREPTIGYALVAVQQSLLGMVSPELRSVVVDLEQSPLKLYIRFYYDGEISRELHQCWQFAQEKAQTYFGFGCLLDVGIERIDYPQKVPFRGRYAYFRKE